MVCTSLSRPVQTATRIALHRLVPEAVTQSHSGLVGSARREFNTARRTMANLKTEVPNLKLNDGTRIPMVSTPLIFRWAQVVDNTLAWIWL